MKKNIHRHSSLNNLLWLIFLIFLFTAAVVFNQLIFWLIFYFFILLLLVSSLFLIPSLYKMTIDSTNELILRQGESQKLHLFLSLNQKKLSSLIQLKAGLHVDDDIYEVPYIDGNFGWDVAFLPRGSYSELPVTLTMTDYFGLLKKKRIVKLGTSLLVLPQDQESLANRIFTKLLQSDKKLLIDDNIDSFQLKALRNFRQGDDYHGIDWKVSAKKQQLVIKEVEKEKRTRLSLVFYGLPKLNFEETLGAFYYFQQAFSQTLNQPSINLITKDQQLITEPTLLDFAEVSPISEEPAALKKIVEHLPEDQQIILFATEMSSYLEEFLDSSERQFLVILVKAKQKIDIYYS